MTIHLLTHDPAHFHAALIHKEMLPGISPTVHVYAPLGPDLIAHLNRLVGFNSRASNPNNWHVEVHASADFLARMLREKPGDVVVLAGRNHSKIDSMLACVDAGLHVLADKPWIIRHEDFPKLERLLEIAKRKSVVVFDIMTERHEITSILQRELIQDRELFGELISGDENEAAVEMVSVHALKKTVAGMPLKRPPEFFDIRLQGEGLTDVGTHLVDLTSWMISPGQAIDYQNDVRMISAERWPTVLDREQYNQITGESNLLNGGESFEYFCNNRVRYSLLGHQVSLDIRWDFELAAGDTHFAEFRGTRSRVRISQDRNRAGSPELDIIPNSLADRETVELALRRKVGELALRFDGLKIEEQGESFRIAIPHKFRVGHEAHFAQVTGEFMRYLANPRDMPAWEIPNLLAKYFVTTSGVRMAQRIEHG